MVEIMIITLLISFIVVSIQCVKHVQGAVDIKEIDTKPSCHKKSKV